MASYSNNLLTERFEISEAMGSANLQYVEIGNTSKDTVEKLLYQICGTFCHKKVVSTIDTNPISSLDHEYFLVRLHTNPSSLLFLQL